MVVKRREEIVVGRTPWLYYDIHDGDFQHKKNRFFYLCVDSVAEIYPEINRDVKRIRFWFYENRVAQSVKFTSDFTTPEYETDYWGLGAQIDSESLVRDFMHDLFEKNGLKQVWAVCEID